MFDWRLIWIIEYTDVLKVGLVAIAILSGLSASISPIVDNAFVATEYEQPKSAEEVPAFLKLRRNKMLQGVAIIVASLAVFLALTYFFGGQNYLLLVLLHVSASMIFFLVLLGIERSSGDFRF